MSRENEKQKSGNAFINALKKSNMTAMAAILVVMIIIASIVSPYFLNVYNLQSVLRDLAFVGMIGIAQSLLLLVGELDLSVGKDLADMEKKSLEAIQERGGAQVGDKTMVDALSPAVDALAANADKGLLEMLKAAEASAKQGVEDTKKYVAKFGRAKSLLERAIGHQDAGATSVYLIFQGMREFVEGKLAKTV